MSGYVRNIDIVIEFDGANVTLTLAPLKRKDLVAISAALQKRDGDSTTADGDSLSGGVRAFDVYAEMLPRYVLKADVKDAAGTEVPVDEWCAASYFAPLISKIMKEHMAKASVANP